MKLTYYLKIKNDKNFIKTKVTLNID